MLLKNFPKLFLQTSRLITDSVRKHRPIRPKTVQKYLSFEILEKNKKHSPGDWKLIRQNLLQENDEHLTENNIDGLILGHFINKNYFLLGSSYINFLDTENIKFNLAATGKYFNLLYLLNEDSCFVAGKKIKEDQERCILKRFYTIRKEHKHLDSLTLESSIAALSLTKDWRTCFELLEEIKLTTTPNSHSYSTTVCAAFLNREENLAWQLLQEMLVLSKNIENIVYHSFVNYLTKLEERQNPQYILEKLFIFMQENDILLDSDEVPLKISNFANKIGAPSCATTVSKDGVCRGCNLELEKFDLSEEEFDELKNKIFENVIIGQDIFTKTDPREVDKFKNFISKQEKFDVVLDGLNIGYSAGTKHSTQVFSALVASVVSYFIKHEKKVLVIGRHHMQKWPKENWRYITRNSTVFLTQNISQDDPYLLFCALNSGKDTIIVTRDLMRGHKFRLKAPKLKLLFNRWLTQRQYQLLRVGGTGNPIFRYPHRFTVTAQKKGSMWHIPFKDMGTSDSSNISWLCIQCSS